jgi:hypothetical protein
MGFRKQLSNQRSAYRQQMEIFKFILASELLLLKMLLIVAKFVLL